MDKKKNIEYWLTIAEKYFDATATAEEEKALAAFLAYEESDIPDFNEIKAVMGYLATARSVEKKHTKGRKQASGSFAARWSAAAAAIAITAYIGFQFNKVETADKDVYIVNINGEIYTDKEMVLTYMHQTMAVIGSTTKKNSVEEQLGAMFSIANI